MTSELSNALNPHVVQPRSRRRSGYDYNDGFSNSQVVEHPRAPPPPSPHVPHRSELELAVVEPPPPPPPR
ncbi:hypothetical protein PHLCEN_2v9392 [Hermanssonia centrifuga]|uniref:Uncharacterized protein n=1 Tax=Hermanssonia centrifuga TaxID=98765 RepID=A0A2R6NQV1_9APHY|nr:hypothetical protein PHLCEN_2v9392 [Hermanssonia centrifuga]